jgi:hypothetical protein
MIKNICSIALLLTFLVSCNQDGGGDGELTYVVIGTLTGLNNGKINLQNNTDDNLTVSINGTFAFATQMKVGESYDVTIVNTPVNRTCNVTQGTGVVSEIHIINVKVICSYNPLIRIGGSLLGHC